MGFQQQRSSNIKLPQAQNQETLPTTTWAHRAWFAAGCAAMLFSIGRSVWRIACAQTASWPWLQSMLAVMAAYLAADLGTGIYHWAIDNYGSAKTPIFGSQIVGFQGHHHRPWEITKMHVAYNVYITAGVVAAAAVPINLLCSDPAWLLFVGVFGGCIMFSQQFHAWAHTPKGRLPPLVVALQDAGIILRRAEHAAHHRPPFNGNYCIVSGVWNRVLDKSKFFVAMETAVAAALGHEPRWWSDPGSEYWSEISGMD